ncbi:MAG: phage integrase N-terminal SAM-like domain-containing protein [Acidiferrobacteraceae bacterium]
MSDRIAWRTVMFMWLCGFLWGPSSEYRGPWVRPSLYYIMLKGVEGFRIILLIVSHNYQERALWGQPAFPRVLDPVAIVCRRRHLSPRTEDSHRSWIRRFICFHGRRHPNTMGGGRWKPS